MRRRRRYFGGRWLGGWLLVAGLSLAGCVGGEQNDAAQVSQSYGSPESLSKDADNTSSGAVNLPLSSSCSNSNFGSLNVLIDAIDWWKTSGTIYGPGKLKLTLFDLSKTLMCTTSGASSGNNFNLFLYQNPSLGYLLGSTGGTANESITYNLPPNSLSYYVKVTAVKGAGNYELLAEYFQDKATFVNHGTYVLGYDLPPNTTFTKKWTIRNDGTSTWNSGYYLKYADGPMSTTKSNIYISGTVAPGQQYTFSVPMKTPATPGTYSDYWQLKNANNDAMKVENPGADYNVYFVKAMIDVVAPLTVTITAPNSGNTWQTLVMATDVQATCQTGDGSGITQIKLTNTTAELGTIYSYTINGGGVTTKTVTFPSVPLEVGTDTITVTCVAGTQASDTMQILVNNTIPVVKITTNNGADFTTTATSATIGGTCTDPNKDIDAVTFTNQTTGWSHTDTSYGNGVANFSDSIPLTDGANAIKVVCKDTHGGSGQKGITVTTPTAILDYAPGALSVTMDSGMLDGSQSIIVQNLGNKTLDYSLTNVPSWAVIQRNGGTLASGALQLSPGGKDTLKVVFNSNQVVASQSATIGIQSNDLTKSGASVAAAVTITPPGQSPPPPEGQPAPLTPTFKPALVGLCPAQNACLTDPVNTALGNFIYAHDDLAIAGRGPNLVFTRNYNSTDTVTGPLGKGWTHSFNIYLLEMPTGDVYVRWGDGRIHWYKANGDGSFTPPAGVFDSLTKGSGFVLINKMQTTWRFTAKGQLDSVTDRHGNTLKCSYDTHDRLAIVTNAVQEQLTFEYFDADNLQIKAVKDYTGRSVQFTYNGVRLSTATDAKNKAFTYTYDAGDRLATIQERDTKVLLTNTYDAKGRVISQADAAGKVTTFAYDTPSAGATTVTDPLGQTHVVQYDALYRVTESKDPGNGATMYLYNTDNLRTQVTDANGQVWKYAYDPRGNLTQMIDPTGAETTWSYDAADLVQTMTTSLGQQLVYTYDADADVKTIASTVDGITHTVQYTYLPTGEVETVTDPMGQVTTLQYDTTGNLLSIVNAAQETATIGHDLLHRLTSVTDPLGNAWAYAYDANGNMLSATDPLQRTTAFDHDVTDRLSGKTSPAGSVTYLYDLARRLEQITTAAGSATYQYDSLNRVTALTAPGNITTSFGYNKLGQVASITDNTQRSMAITFDAVGHMTGTADPLQAAYTLKADAAGRVEQITNPLQQKTAFTYNAASQVKETTDPLGNTTKYTYDGFGRLRSIADPLNGLTQLDYDKASRLKQFTTPSGGAYGWNYDVIGRLKEAVSPSGAVRKFLYDAAGRMQQMTDEVGQTATIGYDVASRVTAVNYSDGTARTVTYDPADRITNVAEGGKTRQYQYDAAGRITQVTDVWGAVIKYAYNTAGRLDTLTYPGGKTVHYDYDGAGRLLHVTDWLGGTTTYVYDASGRPESTTYPNGVTTTYAYDTASHITNVTHRKSDTSIFSSQALTYDGRGKIVGVEIVPEPKAFLTPTAASYDVNTEDQYTSVGGMILEHDPLGTLVDWKGKPSVAYAYDIQERLTTVTVDGAATTITYGPEGERIAQQSPAGTTRYIVDRNARLSRVLQEWDANNQLHTAYIYGMGLIARIDASGGVRYYHHDAQGSTLALTDAQAKVTDTYFYHPFGKVLARTGNTPNPYQYIGALGVEQDGTGLLYMRARYYDPTLGRFIQRDPLGFAAGGNLYNYVGGDPIMSSDPEGLFAPLVMGAALWVTATFGPDVWPDLAFTAWDIGSLAWNVAMGADKGTIDQNWQALGIDGLALGVAGVTAATNPYRFKGTRMQNGREAETIMREEGLLPSANGWKVINPVDGTNKMDGMQTVLDTPIRILESKHEAVVGASWHDQNQMLGYTKGTLVNTKGESYRPGSVPVTVYSTKPGATVDSTYRSMVEKAGGTIISHPLSSSKDPFRPFRETISETNLYTHLLQTPAPGSAVSKCQQ